MDAASFGRHHCCTIDESALFNALWGKNRILNGILLKYKHSIPALQCGQLVEVVTTSKRGPAKTFTFNLNPVRVSEAVIKLNK